MCLCLAVCQFSRTGGTAAATVGLDGVSGTVVAPVRAPVRGRPCCCCVSSSVHLRSSSPFVLMTPLCSLVTPLMLAGHRGSSCMPSRPQQWRQSWRASLTTQPLRCDPRFMSHPASPITTSFVTPVSCALQYGLRYAPLTCYPPSASFDTCSRAVADVFLQHAPP